MSASNDNPFANISSRSQAKLRLAFNECGLIKEVQSKITRPQILGLTQGILERETELSHEPLSPAALKLNLDPALIKQWTKGFLATLKDYTRQAHDYQGALSIYQEFLSDHPDLAQKSPQVRKIFDTHKDPVQQIAALNALGISPTVWGSLEAHMQMRRVFQLYYARYSYDLRDATGREIARRSNQPKPDLALFNRRQTLRASLTGSHSQLDPGGIGLVVNIDLIAASRGGLKTWVEDVRPLFDRQILLVPGIERWNYTREYIKRRFDNDVYSALMRLEEEASLFMQQIRSGQPGSEAALLASSALHQLASLGKPTLCFFNSLRGNTYVGASLKDNLLMIQTPDIYTVDEVNFDWKGVTGPWDAEIARQITEREKKKKQLTPEQEQQERLDRALDRLRRAQAEYDKAAQRAMPRIEKPEKLGNAEQRRIEREAKRIREAAEYAQRREAEKIAADNAAATREENQRRMAAQRGRLLTARQQRRLQEQRSAEHAKDKNQIGKTFQPAANAALKQERTQQRIVRKKMRRSVKRKARESEIHSIRHFRKLSRPPSQGGPKPT